MANNTKNTTSAADTKAEENKKTVPAQTTPETDTAIDNADKITLAERLSSLGEKIEKNKKMLLGVTAAVGIAAVAFAKFAMKQAVESETTEETQTDEGADSESAA